MRPMGRDHEPQPMASPDQAIQGERVKSYRKAQRIDQLRLSQALAIARTDGIGAEPAWQRVSPISCTET